MIYIKQHKGLINKADRNKLNKHGSGVVWFTGLSASGKSTIAHNIEKKLYDQGIRSFVFDGDNIRQGLNSDLGFSDTDRRENLRRIVEVAKLFIDAGIIVLASFITPLNRQREYIRKQLKDVGFVEVFVKCSVQECISRDPKGLYKKALNGEIKNYTGISSPFEEPDHPDLILNTQDLSIEEAVSQTLNFLQKNDFFVSKATSLLP
jgi:adenylylsulfate kinase